MSMMEESQYVMWMNRKQILKSQLQAAPAVGDGSKNYTWEERAFAEDAARVLGGSIWPPRSYSCSFCKREFRSAQALGGHMNVHRRDRARLKQNLSPHNEPLDLELDHHHHHKNDCNSLGTQLSSEISSSQLYCYLNPYSSPATTITTTRLSPSRVISTGENFGQQHTISPYNSSIIWGDHMGSPYSEPEGVVNLREGKFKGLDCDNYVETSLSVGLSSSMFGQKSPTVPCGDKTIISCKRLKKTNISSLPVFLKPCSNYRRLAFQSAEIVFGLNHPGMEDLDLELRLGKQQKVNLSSV